MKTDARKSRKKLYLVFALASLLLGGSIYYFGFKNKTSPVTYKEHLIKKDDLEISVQATGSVQPENRLIVKPQIAGRIDEILVEEGKSVKAGQILAWMSSNDRAALVDMARSSGTEELSRWQEIYKPSPIVAPLGGIIISKQVERGQTVGTGDIVFVVSDRLIILAQVDETDLGKISLNQQVEIRVDAYNDQMVTGKVIRIAYESKQVNNVTIYEIRILPDKVPEFMRSGMTTSVKFVQDKRKDVLLAPVSFLSPVQADPSKDQENSGKSDKPARSPGAPKKSDKMLPGSQYSVLVKSSNPKAEPETRTVTLGITNGKYAEIREGLEEGATILQIDSQNGDTKKSANPFSPFGAPRGRR